MIPGQLVLVGGRELAVVVLEVGAGVTVDVYTTRAADAPALCERRTVRTDDVEEVSEFETVDDVLNVKLEDGSIVLLGTTVVPGTEESDADDVGEIVTGDGLD